MGELGASCFNTLNDKTRDVEKEAWDVERFGMICGKASVFADTKRTILQLCQTSKKCVYDEPKNVVYFYNMNKNGEREKSVTIVKFFNQIEHFTMEVKKLKR